MLISKYQWIHEYNLKPYVHKLTGNTYALFPPAPSNRNGAECLQGMEKIWRLEVRDGKKLKISYFDGHRSVTRSRSTGVAKSVELFTKKSEKPTAASQHCVLWVSGNNLETQVLISVSVLQSPLNSSQRKAESRLQSRNIVSCECPGIIGKLRFWHQCCRWNCVVKVQEQRLKSTLTFVEKSSNIMGEYSQQPTYSYSYSYNYRYGERPGNFGNSNSGRPSRNGNGNGNGNNGRYPRIEQFPKHSIHASQSNKKNGNSQAHHCDDPPPPSSHDCSQVSENKENYQDMGACERLW